MEKGGFSYDFYIQSLNEAYLPKNLVAQLKGEKLIITPDKNGNQLKERFTILISQNKISKQFWN